MEFYKRPSKKAKMAYKAESLNPEKNIYSSMKRTEDRKYVVCLCIGNSMRQTKFPTYSSAIKEMARYRELYKVIKK